ncbi:MAG: hypothetical protein Q8O34_04075 [Rhodocyclaceae bacterium]|nr:hypothetical protein [Rhodocyclaceae bacterium]
MSDDDTPESRKERLAPLDRHYRPPKGSKERKKYDEQANALWRHPKVREQTKQKSQRAEATLTAQQESGAGYPSDAALREFQLDYNNRLKAYGSSYLPTSFAVAEAFFQLRQEFAGFFLLPEEDYLINFVDFVDFVTGPDGPQLDVGAATKIKANTIINVNTLEAPGEFMFTTEDGHSFTVLGASYVRRGDELSMLLVVGEQMSDNELAHLAEVAAEPWAGPPRNKPDMTFDNDLKPGVVFVDEAERLVRDIVLCRFNLQNRRIEARCLLRDSGNRYNITTDIAETLQGGTRDAQEWAEQMGDELDKASAIWECAKMLILLPAYLAARITVMQVEQRTTQFGLQARNSLKFRRATEEALPEAKVAFRRISAIRVARVAPAVPLVGRSYTPPSFQVPVTGFWRTYLDPRLGKATTSRANRSQAELG